MASDKDPRLTLQGLKVLRAFLDTRGYRASGAEIMKATKLQSGTAYPLLARFETAGWLRAEWENIDPSEEGRPRRRYYTLTGAGQRVVREHIGDLAPSPAGSAKWAR